MELIETKGFDLLGKEERELAKNILEEYHPKIQRQIKNSLVIKAQLREYKKDSKEKKYSFHIEAIFAGKVISAQAYGLDLSKAIHQAMKKIESEIEKKYKVSEQK
jgi:ribosome-associated translation inhibitor RaiA